jgi:hypothetical protein
MFDSMRGWTQEDAQYLRPNTSEAEGSVKTDIVGQDSLELNSTGFTMKSQYNPVNQSGGTYIYIAIRRGPLAPPESATEVFAIDTAGGTSPSPPTFTSGFPVDFSFYKNKTDGSNNWGSQNRLTGYGDLAFNTTSAEFSNNGSYWQKDYMNGIGSNTGTNSNGYQWMWKRAPGFFDVVAYTGTGSSNAVAHNLTVAPEMVWIKHRSSAPYGNENWTVGVPITNNPAKGLYLNTTASFRSGNDDIEAVSASTFTVGSHPRSNWSGVDYIAYLFASLPGISKVGSYVGLGAGNPLTIDCGFTSGARFVLIKKTDAATGSAPDGSWFIFDSVRGITASTDPYLQLNTTSAEASNFSISPHSSGFTVIQDGPTELNQTGKNYIFYAIA